MDEYQGIFPQGTWLLPCVLKVKTSITSMAGISHSSHASWSPGQGGVQAARIQKHASVGRAILLLMSRPGMGPAEHRAKSLPETLGQDPHLSHLRAGCRLPRDAPSKPVVSLLVPQWSLYCLRECKAPRLLQWWLGEGSWVTPWRFGCGHQRPSGCPFRLPLALLFSTGCWPSSCTQLLHAPQHHCHPDSAKPPGQCCHLHRKGQIPDPRLLCLWVGHLDASSRQDVGSKSRSSMQLGVTQTREGLSSHGRAGEEFKGWASGKDWVSRMWRGSLGPFSISPLIGLSHLWRCPHLFQEKWTVIPSLSHTEPLALGLLGKGRPPRRFWFKGPMFRRAGEAAKDCCGLLGPCGPGGGPSRWNGGCGRGGYFMQRGELRCFSTEVWTASSMPAGGALKTSVLCSTRAWSVRQDGKVAGACSLSEIGALSSALVCWPIETGETLEDGEQMMILAEPFWSCMPAWTPPASQAFLPLLKCNMVLTWNFLLRI